MKKELQHFLGVINFYRRFLQGAAGTLLPLSNLLKGKKNDFVWTEQCSIAFENAKQLLANATLLRHPDPSKSICLYTDASDFAIGATLSQEDDGSFSPLAFFSRKLAEVETKYAKFDRELLAVYLSIKHFRHMLEGRVFPVITDHKPLTKAMALPSNKSPRQTRQLSFISEFTTDIRYVKGCLLYTSDAADE